MAAFGILSIRLMFNMIRWQDVPKELILFSMSLEMTQDSEPYSNTVIQVVLNNFTLVEMVWMGFYIDALTSKILSREELSFSLGHWR